MVKLRGTRNALAGSALGSVSQNNEPSVEPVLLAALSGLVAVMVSFAALMYWVAQPKVVENAGIASFHEEMRRATATANAMIALENKRAVAATRADFDRAGLNRLVREVASQKPSGLVTN